MLLSIVMMVKNEEKYLDKTLSSLQNLTNDIDSEIIILDTGSSDSTVEIAKKYTNKVYFANWNDNFAEMRNISISYASGEWILILDADERLTNYDKLKKFFNSNLHKKYNSASIEIKNISNLNGNRYSIVSILRMFKNINGFGYDGIIHEKPRYKEPIYNDIASFDHYGYMYENEEIRQLKVKRNIKLLLEEISKNPDDPYTSYQLGKSYMSDLKNNEAIFYIEKSWNLYNKEGRVPPFVTVDLLNLYAETNEFIKCEKLALNYIETDKNNIDVYYYLALSQKHLYKYEDSINAYERYLYFLNNYELSTQANSIECQFNTGQYKETCKTSIIEIYYKLEMYDKIAESIDNLNEEVIKNIYYIIFESLYKLNLECKILELYDKFPKYEFEKNNFKEQIEKFLKNIKECDKSKLYKVFSNIDGNYGILNKLRLGNKLLLEEYNNILKSENESYYGEVLYYALKQSFSIEEVLENVSYAKLQEYIDYLIIVKRDLIMELYDYLVTLRNTLDTKKLSIYSSLSKSLLKHGKLVSEKYENLFLLYIKYNYDFIKSIYSESLSDEDILNVLKDREDIFTIKINIIQKNKNKDLLKYIYNMKALANEYSHYNDGIQILIDKFEVEFNENEELKNLKKQYKSILENSISLGNLNEATSMIQDYENMFDKDVEILNMKAIIALYNGNFEEAELLLKKCSMIDNNNYNTIFNIGYLKESIGDIEEAIRFYKRIKFNCHDKSIILDAEERIDYLS